MAYDHLLQALADNRWDPDADADTTPWQWQLVSLTLEDASSFVTGNNAYKNDGD
jgi:hypothetical protein